MTIIIKGFAIICNWQGKERVSLASHQFHFNFIIGFELLPRYGHNTFQFFSANRFKANRTFSPFFIRQREVVQYTGPAVNVSTLCYFCSGWRVQADWTRGNIRCCFETNLLDILPFYYDIRIFEMPRVIRAFSYDKLAVGLKILLFVVSWSGCIVLRTFSSCSIVITIPIILVGFILIASWFVLKIQ